MINTCATVISTALDDVIVTPFIQLDIPSDNGVDIIYQSLTYKLKSFIKVIQQVYI